MYDALKELMKPEIEEAREEGLEEGRASGIAEGHASGLKEGIRTNFRNNLAALIENGASMDLLYKSFGKKAVDEAVKGKSEEPYGGK